MKEIKESMNNKALIVTTVASTIDQFCMSDISILQKSYKVYVAANFKSGNNTSKERMNEFISELQEKNIVINDLCTNRKPLSKDNFLAYKEIKRLIEKHSFDIIHCHTPIAAMIVRLAARNSRKKGTKVVYTAHGFHFFRGAPLKNWLIYYPIERWLSRYTDILITINKEDFSRAGVSFNARKVEYIPGVGINLEKYTKLHIDKIEKRKELSIPVDSFVVLSVGELNKNKNHEVIIRAIANLNNPKVYYVICGQGALENYLNELIIELGLENRVNMLGYRDDIAEICKSADVFAFPSLREGLGLAAIEAMATGLPIITSNIHGINDYSINNVTGYKNDSNDIVGFTNSLERLLDNKDQLEKMGNHNIEAVLEYDVQQVKQKMRYIYKSVSRK